MEAAQLVLAKRELARRRMHFFTEYTFPDYDISWHTRILCDFLDRMISGEITRGMIFMPPRHSKSEHVSRRLPAFLLGHVPKIRIISCSYSAGLASDMNRDVQRIIESHSYNRLFPNTLLPTRNQGTLARNSEQFDTTSGGSYFCAGVGGGITGRGFDFGIIDDPIKNRAEAESATYRDAVWRWYASEFLSRQQPHARILLMHQRWHEDDLAGRILAQSGESWDVLCLPGLYDPDHPLAHDADPRSPGEPLWPNAYPTDFHADMRAEIGSYEYASKYQQRPTPAGGGLFQRQWFQHWRWISKTHLSVGDSDSHHASDVEVFEPEGVPVRFLTVDLATTTKEENDFTVIGAWGVTPRGRLLLLDLSRSRMEGPDILPAVSRMHRKWRTQFIGIESTGMQLYIVQMARRQGLPVRELKADRDKRARALAATPLFEAGRVFFPPSAPWLSEFEHELLSFPAATHDDCVDVVTYAARIVQERAWGVAPTPTVRGRQRADIDFAGQGGMPW